VHKASASYLCPSTTNNEIKTEIWKQLFVATAL
jgi:hypothetical protein